VAHCLLCPLGCVNDYCGSCMTSSGTCALGTRCQLRAPAHKSIQPCQTLQKQCIGQIINAPVKRVVWRRSADHLKLDRQARARQGISRPYSLRRPTNTRSYQLLTLPLQTITSDRTHHSQKDALIDSPQCLSPHPRKSRSTRRMFPPPPAAHLRFRPGPTFDQRRRRHPGTARMA